MLYQISWRKNANFIEKQELMESELERFRAESCLDAANIPRDMDEVLRFIHDHLFENTLNVAAIRKGCRLRNNNISTRFRKIVGLGLREYVEFQRLNAAGHLLRCHCLEIYLVAMAVGYEHQETFCRAFQRRFGHTPSGYRTIAADVTA